VQCGTTPAYCARNRITKPKDKGMAFPPNYNQDRNNRSRVKARKALEKQLKREEKSAQRKRERSIDAPDDSTAPRQEEKK
jgi:hypothetical protein